MPGIRDHGEQHVENRLPLMFMARKMRSSRCINQPIYGLLVPLLRSRRKDPSKPFALDRAMNLGPASRAWHIA